MTAPLPLPQKLALLDLMTTAKQDPDQVRAEALDLAATHQVATPTEVERALAKLKPAAQAYAWDRPKDQAELFARQAERQRRLRELESKCPRERWYHRVGLFKGIFIGLGLMPVALFGNLFIFHKAVTYFSVSQSLGIDLLYAVTTVMWMSLPAIVFGWLEGRYLKCAEPERFVGRRASEGEDRERPVSPTPEQAARWLAFDEVSTQARAWLNSDAGLMAEDVRLLDARVEALNRTTQKDRDARLLAQLRNGSPA